VAIARRQAVVDERRVEVRHDVRDAVDKRAV
jgi:hypothetical protein